MGNSILNESTKRCIAILSPILVIISSWRRMTEDNCVEKCGDKRSSRRSKNYIRDKVPRVPSFDEISHIVITWIPHHSIQISRRHVARDSLAYFGDDKVVIYIFSRPRRVAISLQSNWSGMKFNVSKLIMNHNSFRCL